jgi:hypothetical protein
MFAVPSAKAATRPDADTVAIRVSLEVQDTVGFEMALPLASRTTAVNCRD